MKKPNSILLISILTIAFGMTTLSFIAKVGVALRLKPQQDQNYTITTKSNLMTMMKVQDKTVNMSQTMETKQSFQAKKVSDSLSVIETQIESIKITNSQQGMKFEYDSEHPEKANPIFAEFDKELKQPVTTTYDALGQLVGDSINLSLNKLNGVIIQLPEQELNVGSKWYYDKNHSINNTKFIINMEYTVTAISKRKVDVNVNGIIKSAEVNGTYNGTASLNPQTGLVMNSNIKENITMTINQQGLSIPMTMVGTTTVEVN